MASLESTGPDRNVHEVKQRPVVFRIRPSSRSLAGDHGGTPEGPASDPFWPIAPWWVRCRKR